jgi:lactoylglutathione lyase
MFRNWPALATANSAGFARATTLPVPPRAAELRVCLVLRPRYAACMNLARKFLHTRYRVDDLERTVKFYRDVLGLKEARRHKSPRGSELVFMKAPESEELIELCSFPDSGPVRVQPDLTHLAFEVDSLQEFGEHLAKLGLKFSDGPTTTSTGTVFAFIDAPEGYEIELIQRAQKGAGC